MGSVSKAESVPLDVTWTNTPAPGRSIGLRCNRFGRELLDFRVSLTQNLSKITLYFSIVLKKFNI